MTIDQPTGQAEGLTEQGLQGTATVLIKCLSVSQAAENRIDNGLTNETIKLSFLIH